MPRTGEVLDVERVNEDGLEVINVKCDPGGGALVTAEHFGAPGDDALPLPGDTAALQDGAGTGVEQAVGYADTTNRGKSAEGERRLYGRDSAGAPVCEVWLKRDGSILIKVLKTGGAPVDIESDGPVSIKSPDVRLGTAPGRQIACVGDLVVGSVRALSAAPGSPIVAVPPAIPTPTGGVPFSGQIVSGVISAKAGP